MPPADDDDRAAAARRRGLPCLLSPKRHPRPFDRLTLPNSRASARAAIPGTIR
jgi:hypothetical protein